MGGLGSSDPWKRRRGAQDHGRDGLQRPAAGSGIVEGGAREEGDREEGEGIRHHPEKKGDREEGIRAMSSLGLRGMGGRET